MCQPRSVLQGTDQQFLLSANLSYAPVLDQRVGHVAEGRLDSLLILRERELALSLLEVDIRLQLTGGKDRLRNLGNESPGTAWTAKKVRERIALKSKGSRQTDGREVSFLCGSAESIFGDQKLFR